MDVKQLNKDLQNLEDELSSLNSKYNEISEEIDDLQRDLNVIEEDIGDIESDIKTIKKQIYKTEKGNFENVSNTLTGDSFSDDFIRASYFCSNDDIRPLLQCVNITDNKLMGCDGYKAIIIKTSDIPKELRNSKIKYNVREDFKENISKIEGEYINLHKIFYENKGEMIINKVTSSTINERLNIKLCVKKRNDEDIHLIKYEETSIYFNGEYLDIVLMCFGNSEFNVYLGNNVSPIIFENDNIMVMILPVRG